MQCAAGPASINELRLRLGLPRLLLLLRCKPACSFKHLSPAAPPAPAPPLQGSHGVCAGEKLWRAKHEALQTDHDQLQHVSSHALKQPLRKLAFRWQGLRTRSMGASSRSPRSSSNFLAGFFVAAVWRAAFAEFVATLAVDFLSYTAVTAILNSHFSHPTILCSLVHIPIHSFGLLAAMPASGAHLNPCISLTALLTGQASFARTVLYIFAQSCAAVVAAISAQIVVSPEVASKFYLGGCMFEMPGPPGPDGHSTTSGLSPDAGFLSEFMYSMIFVYLSYFIAVDPKQLGVAGPVGGPFLLGGILALLIFISGSMMEAYSGAGLNPARCLGPAVVLGSHEPLMWDNHWTVWWLAPALASVVVAAIYNSVPPHHLDTYANRKALFHRLSDRLRPPGPAGDHDDHDDMKQHQHQYQHGSNFNGNGKGGSDATASSATARVLPLPPNYHHVFTNSSAIFSDVV